MKRGEDNRALPLLERAHAILNSSGGLSEAYNDYNLAYTRLQLGSCDGVVEHCTSRNDDRVRSEIGENTELHPAVERCPSRDDG